MPKAQAPIALSIAGSDCSSGAGIQADLKTFTAHGVYGLTAVTATVAETPGNVSSIHPIPADHVADQIHVLFEALPIAAVKTGMLHSAANVEIVADTLRQRESPPPLVIDPVMVATGGAPLIADDAVEAYRHLFPLAALLTPNMDEAATLLDQEIVSEHDARTAAAELAQTFGTAVIVKGGHLTGDTATDYLCDAEGETTFAAPFTRGVATHGTGCTYSAAIAAGLAKGMPLRDAIADAKQFVTAAISQCFDWGQVQALNHYEIES